MKRRSAHRAIGNALLAGAVTLGSGAALAREGESPWFDETGGGDGEISASELDDDRLHRFIDAAHDVQAIRDEYVERIERAKIAERLEIRVNALEKMAQAIETQGLEVSEYRDIGALLESDAGVWDRLASGTPDSRRV